MFGSLRCVPIFGLISLLCLAQSAPNESGPKPNDSGTPPNSSLLGEANGFYRKGDFGKAITKYKEVLQDKQTSPDGWSGLIRSYLKAKNVGAAAQAAEQALAVVDHPRIRSARAEVLFRQGEIREAEKEWVDVINSGYPEARAYLGLARVRRANSMYGSAAKMIRKAHEFNPDDPDIKDLWRRTLPLSQQVEQLKSLLAEETSLDQNQRAEISSFLDAAVEWRKDQGCRLVSNMKAMETPLIPTSNYFQYSHGYRLPVALNGHHENLLLDTGASGIVVAERVAEEAGITKLIGTRLAGIGGTGWTSGSIGLAESIKVGEMEFHNCPVRVTRGDFVAGEAGLIGTDVFQKFLVDVDFPDEKLKLNELPKRPGEQERELALTSGDNHSEDVQMEENAAQDRYIAPEMQSFTRVYRFGHLLLVATSIGDVPPKFFLLDSGAADNFISRSAAEEVTKVHRRKNILVGGVTGSVDEVYTAKKAVLRFGHLSQQDQEMIAFDTTSQSENAGTEISGFLGFATLRSLDITIDYRDGLVNFSFDTKKWNEIKRHHR